MAVEEESFASVLGDPRRRYLAHNYRRVRHVLAIDREPGSVDAGRPTLTARVEYPDNWSTKPGGELRPHLSSLDGMVLGTALLELRMAEILGSEALATSSLAWYSIKAGSSPIENLRQLPVSWEESRDTSTFTCAATFANMAVTTTAHIGSIDVATDTLNAGNDGGMADVYYTAAPDNEIDSFIGALDICRHTLVSRHIITRPDTRPRAAFMRSVSGVWTFPDFLRIAAQAAQILIYRLDGITRTASNNIWMRTARFASIGEPLPADAPAELVTNITAERRLSRGDTTWRTFRLKFTLGGAMVCEASLAYQVTADLSRLDSLR